MKLSGELSFATVSGHLRQATALLADETLDLSGLTRCDSAGVALLLELQKRAAAGGKALRFKGASPQLQELAHSYGLSGILALA